jgi:hypothetical protein
MGIKINNKMNPFRAVIICTFILMALSSNAQDANADRNQTKFKVQFDYLSNYAYNGRVDSIKSPYQTASATLNLANGLYFSGAANYLLANGQHRFDFFELDLGYDYSIGKKISGQIYGTKYFYSGNANLLNGNITSDIGATLNYDLGFLQFDNNLDLFFSNASDFQYTPGVEKSIEIKDGKGTWNIIPGVYGNFSSLNYYESEVNRRLNAVKGPKSKLANLNLSSITSTTTVNKPGFTFLDMEFTVPVSYEFENWTFSITPTLAIPKNPIFTTSSITTISTTGTTSVFNYNSTPYSERNLKNTFFIQLGLSYTF